MTTYIKSAFLVALSCAVLLPFTLGSGVAHADDDRDEYRYGYRNDFIRIFG